MNLKINSSLERDILRIFSYYMNNQHMPQKENLLPLELISLTLNYMISAEENIHAFFKEINQSNPDITRFLKYNEEIEKYAKKLQEQGKYIQNIRDNRIGIFFKYKAKMYMKLNDQLLKEGTRLANLGKTPI